MIAIAQSGSEYHYLNWIASESGPMVTHYGKIDKEINDFEQFKQSHKEILSEIISRIDKEELICTYSLDNDSLIFSTCYSIEDNPDLNNWYVKQIRDDSLFKTMDYYYYPFRNGTDQFLSISIPKRVRKSFQDIIRIFNGRLNGISTGIGILLKNFWSTEFEYYFMEKHTKELQLPGVKGYKIFKEWLKTITFV